MKSGRQEQGSAWNGSINRGGDTEPFASFSRLSSGRPPICSVDFDFEVGIFEKMDSPGLTFNPSAEELVFHYLKNKNSGIPAKLDLIPEADVFKCEPWDLPERSYLPPSGKHWYFFSPGHWKYGSGSHAFRPTEAGYWRTTRRFNKTADSQLPLVGVGNSLTYYLGRPPYGKKTEWTMIEYRLDDKDLNTGANFQNAFVLCHLTKNEPTAKSGGMQNAEPEKCDSSPKSGKDSCDEDKSQLDSMADPDYANFPEVPADLPLIGYEATGGFMTAKELDEYIAEAALLDEIREQCEKANAESSLAEDIEAIRTGGYIELNDILDADSLSSGSESNNGSPGIQLQPRSPALHDSQQDVSSEGTSKGRVRLQLHKMDASAGQTETHVTGTGIHYAKSYMNEENTGSMSKPSLEQLLSDGCGEPEPNSEIGNFATRNEVMNRINEASWCQKDKAMDPPSFSSVFNSAGNPVSPSLLPVSLQPSSGLNVEPSGTMEMSPDTFGTGLNIHVSIRAKIKKSDMNEHSCFGGRVEESVDDLSVVELPHGSVNSVSENPIENSTFGGSLPNSGTLSLEESSEPRSPTSPREGSEPPSILIRILSSIHGKPASAMEFPADYKPDEHIFGQENTSNSGSLGHPPISDYGTASMLKKESFKGNSEYPRLDTTSFGLRARSVQDGGKEKRREGREQSDSQSSSSVQPRAPSGLFSQLSRRVSLTASPGGVMLTCLIGIFFLFLLSSILGIFGSPYSALTF